MGKEIRVGGIEKLEISNSQIKSEPTDLIESWKSPIEPVPHASVIVSTILLGCTTRVNLCM